MSSLVMPHDLATELARAGIIGPRHSHGPLQLIADYLDCDDQDDANDCIAFYGVGRRLEPSGGMCRWLAGTAEHPIIIRWPEGGTR